MHDEFQHFALPGGKRDGRGGGLDRAVDQEVRLAFAEVARAGGDGAQRTKQLGVERVLAEVAVRARTQAFADVLALAVHGEDEDADVGLHFLEAAQALHAAHVRHGEIEKRDVDRGFRCLFERLLAVGCFGDDGEILLGGEEQ